MKIHYLVTSLETGGTGFAIPAIVRTLQKLGHDVSIIACEPRDLGSVPRLTAAGLSYTLLSSKRRLLPLILTKYLAVCRTDRPDIIWTSLSFANLVGQCAAKILRVPVISFKHSASVKGYTYRLRNLSDLWVGDSQSVVDFIQEKMHISSDKVMPWPLFQCDENAPRILPWDGQSRLKIGSVGRLHEVKQYAQLIDALGSILNKSEHFRTKLQLTILGNGPDQKLLEDKIVENNLQGIVELAGFSDNVQDFLAGLHVYIQPSRYEGMCLALHEAMNVGLPVMATPVGEMRNAVQKGKTGFTLSGDIEHALTSALDQIFSDPSILETYGNQAREYVLHKYSQQQFVNAAERIMAKFSETQPPIAD
ncbi:glycosyltransferase family 4 protein [Rosenbergiella epipactidis]|uniref:glycosyltransferase family 4 protein n=1 Tax=Rosenbergiella epipactidis TaxID=1544694 RepID=UPI001F4DD2AC|nr:glycosyltransferase family 4 protein [Rosenbergiella epipactidis]